MAWDLKELESLTIARLMVASPEFVYEQIKFYGTNDDSYWSGKWRLETALLARDDKLINLALAQFGTHEKIIQTIYDQASSGAEDGNKRRYNLGLRIACLSNRHLSRFNWPDFRLESLMAKGLTDEARALLTNPAINYSVLTALYEKSECFEQVDEDTWVAMISISSANERLNIDKKSEDGPDFELMDIHNAIFNCLKTLPVTETSARAMRSFLDALDPAYTTWPEEISDVLKRWGNVELKNYKGEEEEGWLTRLSMKEELRCLIAALYSKRSTKIKYKPSYFGSPDNPDIALRCAFYAGHTLSEKEIEAGFEKDYDVFMFAILKNPYV
ncbi:MAG: hypothetical protein KGJ41_17115, partial [Rhodospirillales bacterium]|nr:hypothetical protein [Rhodospirillales bacterium]